MKPAPDYGYLQDENESLISPLWEVKTPERATEFLFVPWRLERVSK
jgi:hypothetical protein